MCNSHGNKNKGSGTSNIEEEAEEKNAVSEAVWVTPDYEYMAQTHSVTVVAQCFFLLLHIQILHIILHTP